jgi:EAL domain-containing protein (putative c-di-GMP-specific phosphodiesterase class I)
LGQLRATGVRIVLDGFGIGYSSFTYLKTIQFDSIKIDQSFLEDIDRPEQLAILRAIVALSQNLNTPTTIEGIETSEQLEIVRREGCTHAQGFLFGTPHPFELLKVQGPKLLTA